MILDILSQNNLAHTHDCADKMFMNTAGAISGERKVCVIVDNVFVLNK